MPTLFQDLRNELLQFKKSTTSERKLILAEAREKITNLPKNIVDKEQAAEIYRTMSYVATLLNYANALWRIEHQDYFDILVDFKMPLIFEESHFLELKEYFEFHPTAPQMRLKKPLSSIPLPIWSLFREAQKIRLQELGKESLFDLDELDILNPPPDQLYPLPIQMMGRYENEAVDRVAANATGEYRLATRFGTYLLPGGGMIEIDLEHSEENLLYKMLDEHLEEEHGKLWIEGAPFYDEIPGERFRSKIIDCFNKFPTIDSILENRTIRNDLTRLVYTDKTNAEILADIVNFLNEIEYSENEKREGQKKLINELLAALQVETFKLSPLYKEAFLYLKDSTQVVQIEQFGDTRACGGKQLSHSFLMIGRPLEVWFREKLSISNEEDVLGDDLRGGSIEHLTLLQALANFSKVKFSHLLIILANQLECFKQNTLDFNEVWSPSQYFTACEKLLECSNSAIALEEKQEQVEKILAPIDQALAELDNKIATINFRHYPAAHLEAKNLLHKLGLARDDYKNKLYNEIVNDTTEDIFKKKCRAAILIAKPILEKDLDWGAYLQNLLKIFANKILTVAGKSKHSFFELARSESSQAVKKVELDLLLDEASSALPVCN